MKKQTGLVLSAGFALAALVLTACGGRAARPGAAGTQPGSDGAAEVSATSVAGSAAGRVSHRLTLPVPPAMLTSDSARLDYVAAHYWDSMDLRDTTWIADTAAFEQAFANWSGLLWNLPAERAAELAGAHIGRIAADTAAGDEMLLHFADVAEHYWQDPNSPMRNEELYIPVLRALLAAPRLDDVYKIRPRAQLDAALRNRPGMRAAEVSYTTGDGRRGRLLQLRGDYVLLMFYNPGCHDCARVEEYIARSEVFSRLIAAGSMNVLAIYVDEDLKAWCEHLPQMPTGWTVGYNTSIRSDGNYDLPAIPNLYLLDRDKRVIFKDAPVERIEDYLAGQ